MLSVYFSVHRLQVLCNILPWDFKTHTGLTLFVCYMDAYIEFLKALESRGDCGSERVKLDEQEQRLQLRGNRVVFAYSPC